MNLIIKIWLSLQLLQLKFLITTGQTPPKDFFPLGDVTSVTWAHAVNSQEELDATLADPMIRMIEADLCRGRLNSSGEISPWDMVIMAHPPTNISSLSFISFMDQIIDFNRDKALQDLKGVKLDFKDFFAASRAVLYLRTKNEQSNKTALQFPVWLNADVVQGPVNASFPKIKGLDMLRLQHVNLPNATLSLGWTTRFGEQSNGGN
jgi:hypothetical protein